MKLLAIGLLFLAYSALATAAPPGDTAGGSMHADVFVGDLDLSSTDGEHRALERIHRTAVRLCNRDRHSSRIDDRQVTSECVRNAESDALGHLRGASVRQVAAMHPGV
jgi:UrcA family protein